MYWLWITRRTALEDTKNQLDQQTLYLFPERWERIHGLESVDPDFEDGEVVSDVNELDDYWAKLENPRQVSGGDVSRILADDEGWV